MSSMQYRKTWKCGERWVNGDLIIDTKNGCGQDIYKHSDGYILNLRDGKGGVADKQHDCPNRVGSKYERWKPIDRRKYDFQQQHLMCPICAEEYNSDKMPLCPHCFKLECRKCGNLQSWVVDHEMACNYCGNQCDPIKVFTAHERLYGWKILS